MGGPAMVPARGCELSRYDVGSLQTLGTRRHCELHPGAFIQGAVSLRLDRREVHEDVFSVLPLDKAVALSRVKPLHCTFFFHLPIFLLNVFRTDSHRTCQAPDNKKRGCGMDSRSPLSNFVRSGKQDSNALPLYIRSQLRPPATW